MSTPRASIRLGVGVLALSLVGGVGGAVAATSIGSAQVVDDSLRSRDVKDGSLRLQDLAPATAAALRGERGVAGPRGEQGEKGEKGGLGPTSIAQTVAFYGPVQSIAANSGSWVFAGPPAEVVTSAAHPRVVAGASAALGFAPNSADGYADLGLCYRLTSGGSVLNFYGGNFTQHGFTAARLPYTATGAVLLAANSYLVGLCVRNSSNRVISNNNYVNGYAQVTQ